MPHDDHRQRGERNRVAFVAQVGGLLTVLRLGEASSGQSSSEPRASVHRRRPDRDGRRWNLSPDHVPEQL
jgi:hypothetical protein